MSRADAERRTWIPDQKTVLADRLRQQHPEIFPLQAGYRWEHQGACNGQKYFTKCLCQPTLILADGRRFN